MKSPESVKGALLLDALNLYRKHELQLLQAQGPSTNTLFDDGDRYDLTEAVSDHILWYESLSTNVLSPRRGTDLARTLLAKLHRVMLTAS